MPTTLTATTWPEIERARVAMTAALATASHVETAAIELVDTFRRLADSCVLARVFLVMPAARLPAAELAWATRFAESVGRPGPLDPTTPVLTLMATAGRERAWNDRRASVGHRAIPLFDRAFIEGAPMIAALFRALKIDVAGAASGGFQLRALPGGINARFVVEDGATARDADDRLIIAARPFVDQHHIRGVFGMGGSYVGGDLAIAIFFTTEPLTAAVVDRFAPFISIFKMATSNIFDAGKLFV